MRRVYGVYVTRLIARPAMRIAALGALYFAVASTVSVPHVIANVTHVSGVSGLLTFTLSALLNTQSFVQLAVLVASLIIVWTLADIAKNVSRPRGSLSFN